MTFLSLGKSNVHCEGSQNHELNGKLVERLCQESIILSPTQMNSCCYVSKSFLFTLKSENFLLDYFYTLCSMNNCWDLPSGPSYLTVKYSCIETIITSNESTNGNLQKQKEHSSFFSDLARRGKPHKNRLKSWMRNTV